MNYIIISYQSRARALRIIPWWRFHTRQIKEPTNLQIELLFVNVTRRARSCPSYPKRKLFYSKLSLGKNVSNCIMVSKSDEKDRRELTLGKGGASVGKSIYCSEKNPPWCLRSKTKSSGGVCVASRPRAYPPPTYRMSRTLGVIERTCTVMREEEWVVDRFRTRNTSAICILRITSSYIATIKATRGESLKHTLQV
jgi:hypothetical protein